MAKKENKKPTVEAPVIDNEKQETKALAEVTKPANTIPSGLDQNHKVLYASIIQHRKDEIKAANGSHTMYEGLTAIEDAMIIDIAITEAVVRKNPSGLILSGNQNAYEQIKLMAAEMGVTIPEFKTLKAPTKEQLRLAGLSSVNGEGKVVLQIEEKNVSEKTKKKIKEEEALREKAKTKDYLTDHTKIQNESQLKEALGFQLVDTKTANPVERIVKAAQFYRAYLEANAEKAADPKAELDKIHGYTLAELLQDVSTMVPPTFVAEGFGKILCLGARNAESVIPAFNMLKNASTNRKTGVCKFSDEELAALVRVLIVWKCSSETAELSKSIASINESIKILSKDSKNNAKAIASEKAKIDAKTEAIHKIQATIGFVTDPDFDIADNFIAAYNDKENANHKKAEMLFKSIVNTYYKETNVPEIEFDSLLLNVQQHIGIILNLFNSIDLRRDEYSADNLIGFTSEKTEEEKPAEEESKN